MIYHIHPKLTFYRARQKELVEPPQHLVKILIDNRLLILAVHLHVAAGNLPWHHVDAADLLRFAKA